MKLFSLVLTLLLTSNLSLAAGDKGKHQKRAEFLKKELNLSEKQLDKVQEIRKEKKTELKVSRKNFKEAKTSFKEAMKNPKATPEELKAKFDAFQKARDEFQRKRFTLMLEMRSILGPEQLEKFNQLKGKHMGKRKWKKQN